MAFSHGTISHGTLRPQDLLVSFAEAYKQHTKVFDRTIYVGSKALAYWMEHNTPSDIEYDVAQDFLDDLIVQLEAIAADHDSYFGTTEGDGSDFGFWPNDGGISD